MRSEHRVFLGCPLFDGRIDAATASALLAQASQKHSTMLAMQTGSLLTLNCNGLWAAALADRKAHGTKWFAMLHGDVVPDPWWLDTLISEAEANEADLMSAVVPIKDGRGLTSTAIDNPDDPWVPFCRLTLSQLHADFPQTFDVADAAAALSCLPDEMRINAPLSALLVNTGCFVCRLDCPWSSEVFFETRDRITMKSDGSWFGQVQPEDWMFSRAVSHFGGKVMATQKVSVIHRGQTDYATTMTWGRARDKDCSKELETV